jgi:hypothetical protein
LIIRDPSFSEGTQTRVDFLLQSLVLELLFAEHLAALLATAHEVRHHLLGRSKGQILIDRKALARQLTRDLVRETSELTEAHPLEIFKATLGRQALGDVASLDVVRGHEDHVLLLHVLDDVLHAVIVTLMSAFNVIPDWGLVALLGSQSALLIHIGAADQLDAQVVIESLGGSDLHGDYGGHALSVALVAVHNDYLVAVVQPVGHLLAEALNARLNKGLLSVDVKRTVAALSQISNLVYATVVQLKFGEVVFAHGTANLSDLLVQGGALAVQGKEVAAGVAADGGHVSGFITDQSAKLLEIRLGVLIYSKLSKVLAQLVTGQDVCA